MAELQTLLSPAPPVTIHSSGVKERSGDKSLSPTCDLPEVERGIWDWPFLNGQTPKRRLVALPSPGTNACEATTRAATSHRTPSLAAPSGRLFAHSLNIESSTSR